MKTITKENLESVIHEMCSNILSPCEVYVATYNGQTLKTSTGKSHWNKIGHVKNALLLHFDRERREYVRNDQNGGTKHSRDEEFKEKLYSIIKIVKL